jgi:hypothetical protein
MFDITGNLSSLSRLMNIEYLILGKIYDIDIMFGDDIESMDIQGDISIFNQFISKLKTFNLTITKISGDIVSFQNLTQMEELHLEIANAEYGQW